MRKSIGEIGLPYACIDSAKVLGLVVEGEPKGAIFHKGRDLSYQAEW
jgi:hypothetical protein